MISATFIDDEVIAQNLSASSAPDEWIQKAIYVRDANEVC